MAKMNGCNDHMGGTKGDARAQGSNRVAPKVFARNNLSKGGVNKDLGGGATSGTKQALGAGRADANTMKGKK